MAKKKQEQPKIADPKAHTPREIPDYKKPFKEFEHKVKIGDKVKLSVRGYDQKTNEYYLYESIGVVVDTYVKGFRWREEKIAHVRSKPWWGVHDWEILNGDNDDE